MRKIVQEYISHGDYQQVRYVPTELTADSVASMLSDCVYLQGIKDLAAKSERVAEELRASGVSQIGWVDYRVLGRVDRPIAIANGFDRRFVDEACTIKGRE